ncbi:MAG TPA: pilus assembly protein PilM [Polyangiaceae bacterium]|nr:pilus assembly protein PilM [Polyangiaceae bacterium]
MPRFLGIDIGSRVVSAAVMEIGFRKLALSALQEVEIASVPSLEEAVRAATLGLGTQIEAVGVALDGDTTFTHRLKMPTTALKQIDEILQFELEAAVPVDIDELVFGHRLLKRKGPKDPLIVLASAARTEQVRGRIALVKTAIGREPDRVGIGSLALANLVTLSPELRRPEPIAIVDLGGSSTEVTILVGGEAVFVRTLSRGVGSLPEGAPALAAALRQTLLAWVATEGDEVQALYLVGGGAQASGADQYFAFELGVPVQPLPALAIEGVSPEQVVALPRFAKAIGLALGAAGRGHDINLRRGPLAFARGFSFLKEKAPVLVGLVGSVAVSFLFASWAELRALGKDLESATAELERSTLSAFDKATADPSEAEQMLELAKNRAETDPMPHMDAFDVMVELSKAIPMSVTHDIEELDMQRGHVRIQAVVGTTADASLVRDKVSETPCVADAKIAKVTQVVNGTKQKYVLEYDVRCPEDAPPKKKTAAGEKTETTEGSAAP